MRFGGLQLQDAVEEGFSVWLDAICRKAESVCPPGEARRIRQSLAEAKSEIARLEIARQLCQTGKFNIPKLTPFDLDAHLG